jgi:hypothetical protein
MFTHGDTVTVERRAKRDAFGDRIAPSASHTIDGCAIAPQVGARGMTGSSTTDDAQRATVQTFRYIYCPAGADIQPDDAVTLPDGRTYLVEGDPSPWKNPFTGREPGIEVRLTGVF